MSTEQYFATHPLKESEMSEDDFVLYAPRWIIWAGGISAALFWALFLCALFNALRYPEPLGWGISAILLAFTLFLTYLVIYHGSFKTRVNGDRVQHQELFHPKHEFSFRDIKYIRTKGQSGSTRLFLYSETAFTARELLLIAEEPYVGYRLLIKRLEKEGIKGVT
ncbi:MAG: hypothetical protein FWC86_04940 [Coriobacteriia bacterium]|nr:hypothetical protein [Coriobacteriia bacterium]